MSYFPIYLEMTGRCCLVIGGGAVAERKVAGLLEAGAEVVVISPEASDNILRWSKEKSIELIARRYQPGDLTQYEIVFVATDDGAVNAQLQVASAPVAESTLALLELSSAVENVGFPGPSILCEPSVP